VDIVHIVAKPLMRCIR